MSLHPAALLLALLPSPAAARDAIAILRDDDLPDYRVPIEAFTREIDEPVQVFDFEGDRQRASSIADQFRGDPPPLIFALGAKAAWVAARQAAGVPVVYAMVYDPDRYGIRGAFVTGVTMQVPPDMVLSQFQLFAPRVKRIGIIVSADNTNPEVGAAMEAARAAGYEVEARRVGGSRDVRRVFARLRNDVDAIWLLPDADVVTPPNFHYVRAETVRARMPLLVYSETLVQAGALLCVAADREMIGVQAAELARRILDGVTAGTIDPVPPEAPRVVLNRDVQQAIGLKLDDVLLDFVDEVVAEPEDR